MLKLSQKHNPSNTVNTTAIAEHWQASLPHAGSQTNLAQFWQQFDDPLLLTLIDNGQGNQSLGSNPLNSAQVGA